MNISTSNIKYRLKEKIQLHLKEQSSQRFNDDPSRSIPNQVDPPQSRTTEDQRRDEEGELQNKAEIDAQKPGWFEQGINYALPLLFLAQGAKWTYDKFRATPPPPPPGIATTTAARTAATTTRAARTAGTVARTAQVARTAGTVARTAQLATAATTVAGSSIGAIAGTVAAGAALGTLGAYGVNKGIDALMGSKPGEGLADRQFELDTYNPISIGKGIGNTVVDGFKKLVNWEDKSANDAYLQGQKRVQDADAEGKKQTDKFDADYLAKIGNTKEGLEDLKAGRTPAGTPTTPTPTTPTPKRPYID